MADDLPRVTSKPAELLELEKQLSFAGEWAPLYVEPIVGSGERLTFAMVIRTGDGAVHVQRLIRPEVLRLLYRNKARYFSEMLEAAEAFVTSSQGAAVSDFGIDGFSLGPFRAARGRSLQDLVEQGRMMCASLAGITAEEQNAGEADEDERATQHWAQRVQAVVVNTAQDLGAYFAREWTPSGNSISTRLGFFNGKYAANFGVVRKDNPASCLYHLNSRLWQLSAMQPDLLVDLRQRDLILARPKLAAATVSLAMRDKVRDVLDRVTHDADRHQIYVLHTERVEEASRRVYGQARAA